MHHSWIKLQQPYSDEWVMHMHARVHFQFSVYFRHYANCQNILNILTDVGNVLDFDDIT